jgi:hypothetical protein
LELQLVGEITVLLEKSTIFPDRFLLNLPYFPFSLWTNPLMYFSWDSS